MKVAAAQEVLGPELSDLQLTRVADPTRRRGAETGGLRRVLRWGRARVEAPIKVVAVRRLPLSEGPRSWGHGGAEFPPGSRL